MKIEMILCCFVGVLDIQAQVPSTTNPIAFLRETNGTTRIVSFAGAATNVQHPNGFSPQQSSPSGNITLAGAGRNPNFDAPGTTTSVGPAITYTCAINAVMGVCATLNTTIAGLYTSTFTNTNANVYITFGATGLGQSVTVLNLVSYASFRTALIAAETDANDTTAVAASVPSTNPFGTDSVVLTNANARALGSTPTTGIKSDAMTFCTLGTAGCYDSVITISSSIQAAGGLYYRNGSITSGQYDFYTVVEHETDEVLGTASCAFVCNFSGTIGFTPADLFRYHSNGTRSFAAGSNSACSISNATNACFSLDGVTIQQQYNNLSNGEDAGDWVPNCVTPLVQNATGCPGVANLDISPTAEILVLDVVGYAATNITPKNIYAFSADNLNNVSGWVQLGTWSDSGDPNAVELVSLTPNSGTGATQTFMAVVKDGNGGNTIAFAQLVMNTGLSGFNACFVHYDRASNVFFLLNDTGTAWAGLVAGSAAMVSNSQCSLNGIGSGGIAMGTNLTITYNLTFTPAFAGLKKLYMQTVGQANIIEVWKQMGTWTR